MALRMSSEHCRNEDFVAEKEESETSEVHKKVQEFMGKKYEVHLSDGRFIRGTLIATDKDANMVFNRADERWSLNGEKGVRQLGQAMISKKYVKKMILLPEPKEVAKETKI